MTLAKPHTIATPISSLFAAAFVIAAFTGAAAAAQKVAVFPFELDQGDVVPGTPDKHEAEQKRLAATTQSLRDLLAKSGFEMIDTAPVAEKAAAANLQSCGDCADGFANELGADYAVTGVVYKVSELVLSMNVRVHDAASSTPLTSAVVDMRGNTDESWRRAISYLYRNVLSARLEKLKK